MKTIISAIFVMLVMLLVAVAVVPARAEVVGLATVVAAPATIRVPASDPDGNYTVSWAASTTTGASYTLHEATNSTFTAGVRTAYTGTGVSASISGRTSGTTYYYRVRATKTGYSASAWKTGANGCVVGLATVVAVPATITVPASDPDGGYTVKWAASITTGASYTLQEATNSSFTAGVRTAYSGTGLSVGISGRISGTTYYYRVKATKTGFTASAWKTGANGCVVGSTTVVAAPAFVTVPASDPDGGYTVKWAASITTGASYTLQEATNSSFTAGVRTAYSGTGLSVGISGRISGTTYYYRVKATKTGFTASAWKTGANGCVVGSTTVVAAPAFVTVPASDNGYGSYTVSWAASTTAGASYTLQEATDSSFTAGVRTAYAGTGLSASISGRASGTAYYYRVQAIKTGYSASAWKTGTNGCVVSSLPIVATPATVTVPARDADGSYTVKWAASTTTGATYTLQEATSSGFTTGVRTAYAGTGLSASISGRASGTAYYYRVQATKTGYSASSWKTGANGCAVGPATVVVTPATITVPVSDADGNYSVSWTPSATIDVSYTLQEATNNSFTAGVRTAYTGSGQGSASISGRTPGTTYYYRVRATKTGYSDSAWKTGANGCAVSSLPLVAAPASITVPASDPDGNYTVSWTASTTTGASYTLQEATDWSFMEGVRTAYTGTGLSASISGRASGTAYYYRVKATKAGASDSTWTTDYKGCWVGTSIHTDVCPLNDTGMTWYADARQNLFDMPPPGFEGQDADYGRDALARAGLLIKAGGGSAGFDFTKLDAHGNALPASAATWSCVRDNHTGLVWEEKTDDGGLRDQNWLYSWYNPDPNTNGGYGGSQDYCLTPSCSKLVPCGGTLDHCNTDAYVAAINAVGLCGASDWRLPNRQELQSIIDYSHTPDIYYTGDPSIDTGYFPHTRQYLYWSSSSSAYAPLVWCGDFHRGGIDQIDLLSVNSVYFTDLSVRLVRGGK